MAHISEENLAEAHRLILEARQKIEKSDRLSKTAKGILTKAHYLITNGDREKPTDVLIASVPTDEQDIQVNAFTEFGEVVGLPELLPTEISNVL